MPDLRLESARASFSYERHCRPTGVFPFHNCPLDEPNLGVCGHTVRTWIKRFNAAGLTGLDDGPCPGRPATYTADEVPEMIALALTNPQTLALPFACWTLDRLVAYLQEVKGIGIKRSRLDEILVAEGLRWRTHETWFGARVDPAFAEKRGASRSSTRPHPRAAS